MWSLIAGAGAAGALSSAVHIWAAATGRTERIQSWDQPQQKERDTTSGGLSVYPESRCICEEMKGSFANRSEVKTKRRD